MKAGRFLAINRVVRDRFESQPYYVPKGGVLFGGDSKEGGNLEVRNRNPEVGLVRREREERREKREERRENGERNRNQD